MGSSGSGIHSGNENLIIDRILVNKVKQGELFTLDDFEK